MAKLLKIAFVSDVACPWCAIGLTALEQAIERVGDEVEVDLVFRPFELNPYMWPEGQPVKDYMVGKYGSTDEQIRQNHAMITARANATGFAIRMDLRTHVYNTFDAHRLLHWAKLEGHQRAVKKALFQAYFVEGKNSSDHDVLVEAAGRAGLDVARAREVLSGGEYAADVRGLEERYVNMGIRSVPSIIFNEQHLVSGGQPVDVFEQAIRQILAKE